MWPLGLSEESRESISVSVTLGRALQFVTFIFEPHKCCEISQEGVIAKN